MNFAEICVEAPLYHTLTYKIPDELKNQLTIGMRVEIPLGSRSSRGVIIKSCEEPKELKKIKEIKNILPSKALSLLEQNWLSWLASYYLHPLGMVYSMAFAPHDEARKKKSKKLDPVNYFKDANAETPPTPNSEQQFAIEQIVNAAKKNKFNAFLLYGVTGSGKTEVYLRSIEEVLKLNKQALVLVPEISLTPQLIKRFVNRFGDQVAVIHSHLTHREKSDQWQSIQNGQKKILVGARSALFCPMENLGLIIVDEEHEASYKQEEHLKYHARDAAIMKGHFLNCPVVLGSATPCLETWYNANELKKYQMLTLSKRVEDRPLPEVKIIDLKNKKSLSPYLAKRSDEIPSWLSQELYAELSERLENKEQTALFINRRGFAQFLLCQDCGFTEQCPSCSVTLTSHKRGSTLVCHYCGFEKPAPFECGSCKSTNLSSVGLGTEKIAHELQILFPKAKIARADRDEINSREDLESLIEKISEKKVDIIVGTQMIAKGHDFPNLTLVGGLMADIGLHFPDFRSSEKTFQLLTQVAGRAGRHQKKGVVYIQTYLPEHPSITYAKEHDFIGFAAEELKSRKELNYPPFGKVAIIRVQATEFKKAQNSAAKAKNEIEKIKNLNPLYTNIQVLGPTEASVLKLKNKFRLQLLVKAPQPKELNIFLQHFLNHTQSWAPPGVTLSVDVDPQILS
ncbi:MAG: primosomal protein N' [Oligoflexia bacterium]|nr:primosomal protein N' [Oligoflexia bacterium]